MDLATKLSVVALGLFTVGVIWWCVRSGQREQRREKAKAWARTQVTSPTVPVRRLPDGKHHISDDEAVTVPDLLQRAVRDGDPLRLNWPAVDYDQEASRMRPYTQDEFPTGVLPVVRDDEPA